MTMSPGKYTGPVGVPPVFTSPGDSVADSTQSAVGLLESSIRETPSVGLVVQVIVCTVVPVGFTNSTCPLVFFKQNPQDPPSPFLAKTM